MRKCVPDEKKINSLLSLTRSRASREGWKVFTLPQRTLRFNSWIFKPLTPRLVQLFLINNSFSFIHSTLCVSEWNVIWVDNDVKWVKFQVHSKCHVRWDWQRYSSYYNYNNSHLKSLRLIGNVKYLIRLSIESDHLFFECCSQKYGKYFQYSHCQKAGNAKKREKKIVSNLYDDINVLDSKNYKMTLWLNWFHTANVSKMMCGCWLEASHTQTHECAMAKYFYFFGIENAFATS